MPVAGIMVVVLTGRVTESLADALGQVGCEGSLDSAGGVVLY